MADGVDRTSEEIVSVEPAGFGGGYDRVTWRRKTDGQPRVSIEVAGVYEVQGKGWKAGDPCAACGSTETGWSDIDGGWCASCGACDSDE